MGSFAFGKNELLVLSETHIGQPVMATVSTLSLDISLAFLIVYWPTYDSLPIPDISVRRLMSADLSHKPTDPSSSMVTHPLGSDTNCLQAAAGARQ